MAIADFETAPRGSRLDQLVAAHPMPTWRIFAWPIMVMLLVAIGWSYFAQLEEVAVASGEVVPQGKVKVVQHLEGGIIQDIFVEEGQAVQEGETLMQLDLASAGTNQEELEVRLDSERLVRARLVAESRGTELDFPPEIAQRRPALVAAQQQAYEARQRELQSKINGAREQMRQKELEVEELVAKRKAVERNLNLAKERLTMSQSLLSEGLTAKMEHLQLEAEVEDLQGELEGLVPAIPRARAAVEEARNKAEEIENNFRSKAQEDLGETEENIARISELLEKATEQGIRTEIKSPTDGIVKNMRYNTIGGVVQPGEPIMEIVPTGDQLVIETRLSPTDRGYVRKGQKALVKISTYDFARYGGLEGEVIQVAPDTSTDEDGNPYFRVVVQTEKTYLGASEGELPITPGMQATAEIHTGTRSVMDFLIKPVLKLKHEAFRER